MQIAYRSWRSPRIGVVVIAALAFWLTHRSLRFWSVDDAGITYAYSISLADHGTVSPIPESMPVEGYSNPLLFFLVALLRLLHLFDPITTHTKIELVAFTVMSLLVYEILRGRFATKVALVGTAVFVVLELSTPATWLWYASGLENVFVSLSLVALLWVADRAARRETFEPISVGLLGFLVALVRPEAPLYTATFFAGLLAVARPKDAPWKDHLVRITVAAAVTASLYLCFLWWRHATYGAWLPNTYFAKLAANASLTKNITKYLVPIVFPYAFALVFALSAGALSLLQPHRKIAFLTSGFITVSLVMPIIGGNDWMGEHRFATAFLAMSHFAPALLISALYARNGESADPAARRILLTLSVAPVIVLTLSRVFSAPPTPNNVTTARVFEMHGVRRMQHQRRLGVINPVVIAPDAGGMLLYRSAQYIDNGFLTDFQMAHMARDLKVQTQFQVAERGADLADTNHNWPFERRLVGSTYLAHKNQHMFVRHDLVDVEAAPDVAPFYAADGVRVYMSPDNVLVAGPRGLVRIEIVIAWDDAKAAQELGWTGSLADDNDSILLSPYGDNDSIPKPAGIQRRALLLRAPDAPGTYPVSLELVRGFDSLWRNQAALEIRVVAAASMQPAVDAILTPPASPDLVLKRFAWLREQSIPRLTHVALRKEQKKLVGADRRHDKGTSRLLKTLAWDARLASLTNEVPAPIRAAEQQVLERVLGPSACATARDAARRALCIGRAVDRLRRYGYFGVVARVPAIRADLEQTASTLGRLDPDQQYVALVGLTLAMPERVELQKALLSARARYAKKAMWPSLEP